METLKAILGRRSIRRFTTRAVSDELVEELLVAAMAAPSAGNEQPWHFIIVSDRSLMEQMMGIHPYAGMLTEAPLGILICGDEMMEKYEGYWPQDCSAATQNLLLAAYDLGLGAVWCGIYPTPERVEAFRKLFKLPAHIHPFAVVPVGYPAEKKPVVDRYDPTKVRYNTW